MELAAFMIRLAFARQQPLFSRRDMTEEAAVIHLNLHLDETKRLKLTVSKPILNKVLSSKGRFTRYDFVAYEKLTTSLRQVYDIVSEL